MIPLPHDLNAEQAVLGAILHNNATLAQLRPLSPDDFYDPVHGRIFSACSAAIAAGKLADGIRLKETFARDDALEQIGGAGYILTLLDNAALLTAHAREYAEQIFELAERRRLVAIGQTLMQASLHPRDGDTPLSIAAAAERSLQAVGAAAALDVGLRTAGAQVVERLSQPFLGLSTGIPELDNLIGGLIAPDLIILAGRPGMGKSSLAMNIAFNVARGSVVDENGHDIRPRVVAFFSMEMSAEQLAGRALARQSTRPGAMAFGYSTLYSRDRRPKPESVSGLVQFLPETLRIDESGQQTVAGARAICRDIKRRYGGLDLIAFDYLQLMTDPSARRDGRVQELTAITGALKALAKSMNVPVLALSQLSRQVEARQDKIPQNSDLRESGSIEQDADTTLFAYREHYYLCQNEPKPRENESDDQFRDRHRKWEIRKRESLHEFDAICGKRRHGPVGVAKLYCDLAYDVIRNQEPGDMREPPTPRRQYWQQD